MTLRDLTRQQLYNLRRRAEKERKTCSRLKTKTHGDYMSEDEKFYWNAAYNKGVRAGLEFPRP